MYLSQETFLLLIINQFIGDFLLIFPTYFNFTLIFTLITNAITIIIHTVVIY